MKNQMNSTPIIGYPLNIAIHGKSPFFLSFVHCLICSFFQCSCFFCFQPADETPSNKRAGQNRQIEAFQLPPLHQFISCMATPAARPLTSFFSLFTTATVPITVMAQFSLPRATRKFPNTLQWHNSSNRLHNMMLHAPQNADQPFAIQRRSLCHLMLVLHAPILACDVLRSFGDHASRCISSRLRLACMHASL